MNRLAVPPPFSGMQTGLNNHVGEDYVRHVPVFPLKDADPSVGIIDADIFEQQIARIMVIENVVTDTDPARARMQNTVINSDIIRTDERNGIISRIDQTVRYKRAFRIV